MTKMQNTTPRVSMDRKYHRYKEKWSMYCKVGQDGIIELDAGVSEC